MCACVCVYVYREEGGAIKKCWEVQKKLGGILSILVYNLSIWRVEPAVMRGENVLDGDDSERARREGFLGRQEEHSVGFGNEEIP